MRYRQEPYGDGPFTLETRYITEDIPVGCYLISHLGKKFGAETPVIDAMITLGCSMLKRDLMAQVGYTVRGLGVNYHDAAGVRAAIASEVPTYAGMDLADFDAAEVY
ncbi:MAG: NAD/NADP octopine/nopaline dehydrogenase family protein, partial [Sporomusa sp.]